MLDAGDATEEHGRGVERRPRLGGLLAHRRRSAARRPGQATGGAGHDDAGLCRSRPASSSPPGLRRPVHRRRLRRGEPRLARVQSARTCCPHAGEVAAGALQLLGGHRLRRRRGRAAARSPARAARAGRGAVRRRRRLVRRPRRSDHAGLGDWTPDPDRFPDGLRAAGRRGARGSGMRFGLWVEPEMVNPDSDLYRAHPDWVLHFPRPRRAPSCATSWCSTSPATTSPTGPTSWLTRLRRATTASTSSSGT